MKNHVLLRCTCPNCDDKFIKQIEQEVYDLFKDCYVEEKNRIITLCDRCSEIIEKQLMKSRPDPV